MKTSCCRILSIISTMMFIMIFAMPRVSQGVELSIPPVEAKSGERFSMPVMLDKTDNLAGLKLVMDYNEKLLMFVKAVKSKQTASLMHIVNDKQPGTLIIVMAGAKGISGKNFPLVTLIFKAAENLNNRTIVNIKIRELQMMDDKLKNIKHKITVNPLTIFPKNKQIKIQRQQEAGRTSDKDYFR